MSEAKEHLAQLRGLGTESPGVTELFDEDREAIAWAIETIDKLPKCWRLVDGVLVQDVSLIGLQDPLWVCGYNSGGEIERHDRWDLLYEHHGGGRTEWTIRTHDGAPEHNEYPPDDCYSTREAAAAHDAEKEGDVT